MPVNRIAVVNSGGGKDLFYKKDINVMLTSVRLYF